MGSRALIQGIISVGVLGVSTLGMLWRVEPFASWYYPLAWWPFILGIDSLVLAIQGHSLLTRNPREFLFLSAVSVPFWLVFEGWNLAMKNWYYVGVPPSLIARWVGCTVSFSTVLPAIFEATELMAALGLFRQVSVRPIKVGGGLYTFFWLLGGVLLLLPLLIPQYTFPLIWGGFVFLLEPINHRLARRSLLREWEQGSLRTFVRLLVGGMICGLVWEVFNFWALTKWIYTVPFFERLKLFEMPIGGFFGFPPFAVECYVIVQFIGIFRGGKGWEPGDERPLRFPFVPKAVRWVVAGFVVAGSLGIFHLMDLHTVNSLHPRATDLKGLAPQEVSRLQEAGVDRLDLWLQGHEAWRLSGDGSGLSPEVLARWKRLAALATLKGIGTGNLRLLWTRGVRSVGDLAQQDPRVLGPKLRSIQGKTGWARQPPRDAQVRLWVREATRVCAKTSHDDEFGCR